jgi:acyl-CoA thioesterase I
MSAVLFHKPEVAFIEFITNDAYLQYKISLEDSKKNLNTMIDRILAANSQTEIILQTMNFIVDKPGTPSATDRPKLADYAEGYRQVAKARGLLLVDNYPQWLKLLQDNPVLFNKLVPDGVHPQAEGYRTVLLPKLEKTLMSMVEKKTGTHPVLAQVPSPALIKP